MDLTAIFIIGFIVLGIYKLVELFARKNERMALIEKLPAFVSENEAGNVINFPEISFVKKDYSSWALRFSLLLTGVGVGCLLAFILQYSLIDFASYNLNELYERRELEHLRFILYFSGISVFGGLGLLAAYLIERKEDRKQ
ncbi:MAG: hypothetical protein LBB85_03695, partial [Dysgonamonadaceae bacterium]|nr:hypothetical protein [Dysgonamonadaceae bacterium]